MGTTGHVLSVPIGRIDSSLTAIPKRRIVNARAIEAKGRKNIRAGTSLVIRLPTQSRPAVWHFLGSTCRKPLHPPLPPPSQTSFLGYFIGQEGSRRHYDPAVSISTNTRKPYAGKFSRPLCADKGRNCVDSRQLKAPFITRDNGSRFTNTQLQIVSSVGPFSHCQVQVDQLPSPVDQPRSHVPRLVT
jgi:hypothetical protein